MPTAYERLVLVFNGDDDDALAAARGAWTDSKAQGFEVTYWQPDERGRWQRKARAISQDAIELLSGCGVKLFPK